MEKHADFIAAYGKKKDDYVSAKMSYLLQLQNDVPVRVVAQRCLTACHSLKHCWTLDYLHGTMLYFCEVEFGAKDGKWKVFYI